MTPTPLLIVSDGPNEPTGLGRIARDLAGYIHQSDLPVDLVSVGGPPLPYWQSWRHVPMGEAERGEDWGAGYVGEVWQSLWGSQPGILWVIWDPSRLAAYTGYEPLLRRAQVWSYPAIDAPGLSGGITGPAGDALARADRVIAYGRWASQVIKSTRPEAVPYLPHGIDAVTFGQPITAEEYLWTQTQLGPHVGRSDIIIGCVATNQARKDLSLFFRTLVVLRDRGVKVHGWLHTDVLTKAWSIVQLVEDLGLQRQVTVSTRPYTDRELACLYQRCSVTIAPGLGEGFGYPIVESLAAGTPVVHGDFGGGRELVPRLEWRFPIREMRCEGVYALLRPVFRAEDVANAIERVWRWQEAFGEDTWRAYCRGSVAHLEWGQLWPRWRSWIRSGLES